MAEVRWTGPAVEDLRAIAEFIAKDSENAAVAVAARIFLDADRLADHPDSGRIVPEQGHLREIVVSPYRIVYRREDDVCTVLCVIHGKQPFPAGVQEARVEYRASREWKLPTFGKGGLRPGIDLDNSADLLDRMTTGKPF